MDELLDGHIKLYVVDGIDECVVEFGEEQMDLGVVGEVGRWMGR